MSSPDCSLVLFLFMYPLTQKALVHLFQNSFSGKLLSHLKSYLLWLPFPLWLRKRNARMLPGALLSLLSRWISAWALIPRLLGASLTPCTTVHCHVVGTRKFWHPQLPTAVPTSRVFPCKVGPPCYFLPRAHSLLQEIVLQSACKP